MQHRFQRASLAPPGFAVDEVKVVADSVQVRLRSRYPTATCPNCGRRIFCEQFDNGVLARHGPYGHWRLPIYDPLKDGTTAR